ncbi:hypothetical protein [Pendulispora albinea]|uniref:Uncharacterized protein n=1 Tax=Pendulispora albinea TaxID=2741071 RepID=A0ABZ2LYB5_9BACT
MPTGPRAAQPAEASRPVVVESKPIVIVVVIPHGDDHRVPRHAFACDPEEDRAPPIKEKRGLPGSGL